MVDLYKFDLDIPQEYKDALNDVRKEFPHAFLAGGALRDLVFNKPVKDLDIFAPQVKWIDDDLDWLVLKTDPTLENQGYKMLPKDVVLTKQDSTDFAWKNIKGSDTYQKGDNIPVNVVVTDQSDTICRRLELFDYGICQIAYDGNDVWVSDAFLHDKKESKFTYLISTPNMEQFEHNLSHFFRLKEKYPEFNLDIPPTTRWYEKNKTFKEETDSEILDQIREILK